MTGSGTLISPWDMATGLTAPQVGHNDTVHIRAGTYEGYFTESNPDALLGSEITIEPYTGEEVIVDGGLTISTRYANIKNIHFKNTNFIDRLTTVFGTYPNNVGGIRTTKNGIMVQDCIIENMGVGFSQQDSTVNIVLDGCIIYYCGWDYSEDTYRNGGHGVYCGGSVTIKNCIVFTNAGLGIKVYAGDCSNSIIEDNISFNNSVIYGQPTGTAANIFYGSEAGGGRVDIENPIVRRNCTYQLPAYLPHNINEFGYAKTFHNGILEDNYMPDGCDILSIEDGYTGITWADGQPSGNTLAPEETNHIKVYDVRGRAHVAVYNWELLDTVTIDLSTVTGMNVGDSVTVTNVEDYFVDILTKTLDANKCISVSMKAVDHTVQAGQGFTTPATCFPEFGCFVIRKV